MNHRNRDLLDLAKGRQCLLRLSPKCDSGYTTVAAHSNAQQHGKGKGIKANDEYTVWACFACHWELDMGNTLDKEQKRQAFDEAHKKQIREWQKIVADMLAKPRDRAAAAWAITMLEQK